MGWFAFNNLRGVTEHLNVTSQLMLVTNNTTSTEDEDCGNQITWQVVELIFLHFLSVSKMSKFASQII